MFLGGFMWKEIQLKGMWGFEGNLQVRVSIKYRGIKRFAGEIK